MKFDSTNRFHVSQFVEDIAVLLDDLEESREQADRGETVSAEEARERLGLDD